MTDDTDDGPVINIPPEQVAMAHRGILIAMLVELIRTGALDRDNIIGRLRGMATEAAQGLLGEGTAAEMTLVLETAEEALDYDQQSH